MRAGALAQATRKPQACAQGEKRTLSKPAAFVLFKQSVPQGQQARGVLKEAQQVHKEKAAEQSSCTHRVCFRTPVLLSLESVQWWYCSSNTWPNSLTLGPTPRDPTSDWHIV